MEDIALAIVAATNSYWLRLEKWLDKNLPSLPKQVIIGGGAAAFVEPELEQYFNCVPCRTDQKKLIRGQRAPAYTHQMDYKRDEFAPYSSLEWLSEITNQVERTFRIGYGQDEGLAFRLIDCFGMMDQLLDKTKEVKGGKNEKTA